jgi:hypothetical protein
VVAKRNAATKGNLRARLHPSNPSRLVQPFPPLQPFPPF